MAELTVNCPVCGHPVTAGNEMDVARLAKEHMKKVHDTELPLEEAQKMVKDMLKGESGK